MWVVIISDGDIDYTDIYGPFDTEQEAEASISHIEDNDDYSYRVIPIQSLVELESRLEERDEDDEY